MGGREGGRKGERARREGEREGGGKKCFVNQQTYPWHMECINTTNTHRTVSTSYIFTAVLTSDAIMKESPYYTHTHLLKATVIPSAHHQPIRDGPLFLATQIARQPKRVGGREGEVGLHKVTRSHTTQTEAPEMFN